MAMRLPMRKAMTAGREENKIAEQMIGDNSVIKVITVIRVIRVI